MEQREVVVVGGGLAGSACAAGLARAGHDVLLVDQARFPRPKPCAEYASPETLRVLSRIGALEALQGSGLRPLRGIAIRGPGGGAWMVDHHENGVPRPSLAVPRDRVDAALLEWAGTVGVDVRQRTTVRGLLRERGQVTGVTIGNGAAPAHGIRAQLVIGADGVRSVVARDLGVRRMWVWPRRLGLVARYHDDDGPADCAELHLAQGAYCGLTPLGDGNLTVTLVTGLGPGPRLHGGLEPYFDALLERFPAVSARLAGARRAGRPRGVGPLGLRVSDCISNGAMLIGDAAGFFDPLTGEGIYRALRGAELAADVGHLALRANDLSAPRLARYGRLRQQAFEAKSRLAQVMQVFACLPPLADYGLRRLQRRARLADALGRALGDYGDPRLVLTPRYFAEVLRP